MTIAEKIRLAAEKSNGGASSPAPVVESVNSTSLKTNAKSGQ